MKSTNHFWSANRSLPSFHFGFIALTPTSDKSWSVPIRARPCENQLLTESLFLTGFFVFSIYVTKISQSTRRHRVPRAHLLHANPQHCVVHADFCVDVLYFWKSK